MKVNSKFDNRIVLMFEKLWNSGSFGRRIKSWGHSLHIRRNGDTMCNLIK